ncbi:hypothetical protein DMUE_0657 [Dictyocoela muelleri]|nr:hypothetical protein DMUE_0657 [Dictyocoela muelleri]
MSHSNTINTCDILLDSFKYKTVCLYLKQMCLRINYKRNQILTHMREHDDSTNRNSFRRLTNMYKRNSDKTINISKGPVPCSINVFTNFFNSGTLPRVDYVTMKVRFH